MAMSPSPQLSPSMGIAQRIDRHRDNTPPAQPLSKRDKKRTQLIDRLNEITQQFDQNKDRFYRSQLQAIQIDAILILHADPYSDSPLFDSGEEIQELIARATSNNPQAMMAVAKGEADALGGKIYSEFARAINDATEVKDTNLTMADRDHSRRMVELNTHNAFMMKLATEEHKALASTLRDRLINSVTMRKIKLGKEKDELYNIGDSNALSLNPNQFTLNNPSSPGGVHGKRATRHRRDVDELSGFSESHKRKRKAVDDIGSPAPSRRHIENGFSNSVWTAEQQVRAANKGTNSPIYSVDKLFTEKELAMTYNQAAQAAYSLILQHKARYVNSDSDSASNDGDGPNIGDGDLDNEANDSPPSAPFMDRQVSHATRSTRGLGLAAKFTTATGIDVLSDMTSGNNYTRMSQQISNSTAPKLPPLLSAIMTKAYIKENANTPISLSNEELALDFQNIERAKRLNETGDKGENISRERGPDREMLAAAVAEKGKYIAWIPSDQLDGQQHLPFQTKHRSKNAIAVVADDIEEFPGHGMVMAPQGMGGVPMSKASSIGGSEAAGGLGGVPMSRTASRGESSAMGKRRRGL